MAETDYKLKLSGEQIDKALDFSKYGATYNGNGTWTVNGLTDMTFEQMLKAEKESYGFNPSGWSFRNRFANGNARTNFIMLDYGYLPDWEFVTAYGIPDGLHIPDCFRMFFANYTIETAVMCREKYTDSGFAVGNAIAMFYGPTKLKRIINLKADSPAISLHLITDPAYVKDMFLQCIALEEVKIKSLRVSLSFSDSPNLSKDSILYLIQNSAATSAITVTLHATAYEMAIADTDIQAALQQKTFVSLAQAETA